MTNRIFLWDNLKFFLICCVVVGHFVDQHADVSNTYGSIFLFIYSFHIPLFIFISGLFYNDKNILKKVIYFFSIGYLYKIVSAIIDRLLGNVKAEFILLSGGGISWFMFAIAIYMIIGYLLRNQNKKFIFLFSIMLACFVGYDQTIGDFLYLSRIIIFLPFFLLGLVVRNKDIVKLKKNKILLIAVMIILLIWLISCFYELDFLYRFRYLFTGRNPFFPQIIAYGPLYRLISYIISMVIGLAIILLMPNSRIKGVSSMGQHSINVYFWHMNIYYILEKVFRISEIFKYGVVGKISFLLLAILFTIVLSRKAFEFPLKTVKRQIMK